jgi:hypothetical protein
MWFPGEQGGAALADVLCGDFNPSGRLPITFPKSVGQVPFNFPARPGSQERDFGQVFGPLYPFGHGLSYTTFKYANLRLTPERQNLPSATVTVTADITNTGARAGDEVVQLYLRDDYSSVTTYDKALRGFARVSLAPARRSRSRSPSAAPSSSSTAATASGSSSPAVSPRCSARRRRISASTARSSSPRPTARARGSANRQQQVRPAVTERSETRQSFDLRPLPSLTGIEGLGGLRYDLHLARPRSEIPPAAYPPERGIRQGFRLAVSRTPRHHPSTMDGAPRPFHARLPRLDPTHSRGRASSTGR